MSNQFDVPRAAMGAFNDAASRRVRQDASLEQRPAQSVATLPGQERADVASAPTRIQLAPATPSYRRSLFRR